MATLLALGPSVSAAESASPNQSQRGKEAATARRAHRMVTLTGFTRARATMQLIAETSGRCLTVLADVGQSIGEKGVFARLDDTFVSLDLRSNRVEQSRLKAQVAYLKKEAGRSRILVRKKSQAQAKLDGLEHDLAQAEHQLQALVVGEKTLIERKARHIITAPPGWKVISRRVEPGQWVAQGALVGSVGDFSTLLVPIALSPGEYQALMQQKKPLKLELPDIGKTCPADIEKISPAFDPATRKINLELAVKSGLGEMRGGLRARFSLRLPDASGAVLVPAAAVVQRYQEYWLTRKGGGRVRVMLLGDGPGGAKRVISPEVKPGQQFLLP